MSAKKVIRTALTFDDEEFLEALMDMPRGKKAAFIVRCAQAGFHGGQVELFSGDDNEIEDENPLDGLFV